MSDKYLRKLLFQSELKFKLNTMHGLEILQNWKMKVTSNETLPFNEIKISSSPF